MGRAAGVEVGDGYVKGRLYELLKVDKLLFSNGHQRLGGYTTSDSEIRPSERTHCPICGKKWSFVTRPFRGQADCTLCGAPMHSVVWSPCWKRAKSGTNIPSSLLARILELYPGTQVQSGPPIAAGAYYLFCPECFKIAMQKVAAQSELVGRHEDAAQAYESLGMLDKARQTREAGRNQVVRHITVNLNDLIDRIGRSGLALPYKCPSCGATISVDGSTKAEGLRFCSYCGTTFNLEALARLLESALR